MRQIKHICWFVHVALLMPSFLGAQAITGRLKASGSALGVADALIKEKVSGAQAYSGQEGDFTLKVPE